MFSLDCSAASRRFTPLISVLLPARNAETSVRQAATSILNNTYRNLQLILIDDASTDHTATILKDLSKTDQRCLFLQNRQTRGISFCLNLALRYADGSLIARMDADDVSHPSRLQIQENFLKDNPQFDFVGTAANLIDRNYRYGLRRFMKQPSKDDLIVRNPFIHPTVLFRKDALLLVNGYKDTPFTRRCEDYDLFFRLYAAGCRGYNLPLPLLDYSETQNDASKHTARTRFNEFLVRFRGSIAIRKPIGCLKALKSLGAIFLPKKLYFKLKYSRKENQLFNTR